MDAIRAAHAAQVPGKLRLPELDALRFLAALGVVFYHYTYHHVVSGFSPPLYPRLERVTAFGYLGVNLFFIISGFVVLWTARERPPGEFVVARVVRLYPEFWMAVLLSSVAFAWLPGQHPRPTSLAMVAANLTMVPRLFQFENVDGVYWTLLLELKFYLFLWMLSIFRQLRRIEPWLHGWLILSACSVLVTVPGPLRALTLQPYAPLFIAGCFFYLARAHGWSAGKVIALTACLALATSHARSQLQSYVISTEFVEPARQIAMGTVTLFFASFVLITLRRPSTRPLAVLKFLGAITYPLYLTHNVAKAAMASLFHHAHPIVVLAGAVLFSMGLAAGIVTVVERYFRKPFARLLTVLCERCAAHWRGWFQAARRWMLLFQTRRAAVRVGLCGAALLIGVEGVLRVGGFGHPVLLQGDGDVGYLFQADQHTTRLGRSIHINAFHQRSDNVTALPAGPERRVLIVGDSVTFGTTLLDQKQTISERLREALHTWSGSSWEVLNASAGSWGPGNELAYLERFGTFGAGEVVLQIGSHDLLQSKSTSARVGIDPSMPNHRPLTALGEVWSRYLWPRWRGDIAPAYPPQPNGQAAADQFDNNLRSVCEMIRLIRECGSVPIVLHTPNRNEVVSESGAIPSEYGPWRERFLALLNAQNVPVINLAELWAVDPKAADYFLDHVHLSPRGTAAAARSLLTSICDPARSHWSVVVRDSAEKY